MCVCVCLNFLFYPIDLFIYFYVNTTLCWLLQLYKSLKIRWCKPLSFQNCANYFRSFAFPCESWNQLINFYTKACENLTEVALTLYISWGRIDIVTIINFLTNEYNIFFHLFGFSLTFNIFSSMFCSFQSTGLAHHFSVFLIFQC